METSDIFQLGAGLALGGIMTRSFGNSFADAIDARTSIAAITIPQTRQEIQALLDKLDVRLANGQVSEALYKTITAKWQARLQALESQTP